MKKNILFLISIIIIFVAMQISTVNAQMHEENYSTQIEKAAGIYKDAHFVVQELKYEPYPVNPGDWFDFWVKVQNIGQSDAQNAEFRLLLDYPFESGGLLVRDYGVIPGMVTAYQNEQSGDVDVQANQVIMKFRIKVADNAPEGENVIKLQATANPGYADAFTYSLPIEIGKTKTDFDVIMQDSTSQGTSFSIANIGDNDATAVKVSIEPQGNLNLTGIRSSILGNLDKGDFTTVTFQVSPNRNIHELKMQISYTDIAGVRNIIEKNVSISTGGVSSSLGQSGAGRSSSSSLTKYIYLVIGIILGILIVFGYKKIRRKKF